MNGKHRWLLIAAIFCVILGVGISLFQHFQAEATENYITSVENRFEAAQTAIPTIEEEFRVQSPRYAVHWTRNVQSELEVLKPYLGETGIPATIQAARDAQRTQQADPNTVLAPADRQLAEIEAFVTKIFGSGAQMGYYAVLADQADKAMPLYESLPGKIDETRTYILELRHEAWNWEHGVRMEAAFRRLNQADQFLVNAQEVIELSPKDANVDLDRPLLYRYSQEVLVELEEARESADNDNRISREAATELAKAEQAILTADKYILESNWRQMEATTSLATARRTYDDAYDEFWGQPRLEKAPNYVEAKRLSIQAQQEAYSAQMVAATPTPTPVPSPTPRPTAVPVVVFDYDDDDDDSGGGFFDFGGSSGSSSSSDDDFGGYDFGGGSSSSDDWGSNDSFGGSDSFGSDDSFGGSDSWGSDDGF